jgi:hypothetical protein
MRFYGPYECIAPIKSFARHLTPPLNPKHWSSGPGRGGLGSCSTSLYSPAAAWLHVAVGARARCSCGLEP